MRDLLHLQRRWFVEMGESSRPLVHLVLRYDDYGATYSPVCAARYEVEALLHRVCTRRGWPWLCAITPRQSVDTHNVHETRTVPLSEDRARMELLGEMMRSGVCEPAVHGLTHHTWKQLPRYGTEFAGLPLERQIEILQTARREVEAYTGRTVDVFVPPWNSYDAATVEAAGRVGLTFLSTGLITHCRSIPPVRIVPATVELQQLRETMEAGYRYPAGTVLVILMHATDFVSVDRQIGYLQLDEFEPLMDRIMAHFDAQIVPAKSVPALLGPALEQRSATAAVLTRLHSHLADLPGAGRRVRTWLLPRASALLPEADGRRIHLSVTVLLFGWFLLAILLAAVPGWLIAGVVTARPVRSGLMLLLSLCGAAALLYCGRNAYRKLVHQKWGSRHIGYRTWTGLAAGASLLVTGLASWAQSLEHVLP